MSARRLIAAFLLLSLTPIANWRSLCELNCTAAASSPSSEHGGIHGHMRHDMRDMRNCQDCLHHETGSIMARGCEHPEAQAVQQSRLLSNLSILLSTLVRVPKIAGLDSNSLDYIAHFSSPGCNMSPPVTPLRI